MLTIYTDPVSLYCAKLRILLRHKGIEWREEPPPGGYGSAAYKQVVPSGNLPAMVEGDFTLADSEAIAEYLNDIHHEPAMLPSDARAKAKARERSRFHDTRLEPELRALFSQVAPAGRDMAVAAKQARAISDRLAQFAIMLDDAPGMDGQLTLGDCGYPITFAWIAAFEVEFPLTIRWPEPVIRYRRELMGHAAVATELVEYAPRMKEWIAMRTDA